MASCIHTDQMQHCAHTHLALSLKLSVINVFLLLFQVVFEVVEVGAVEDSGVGAVEDSGAGAVEDLGVGAVEDSEEEEAVVDVDSEVGHFSVFYGCLVVFFSLKVFIFLFFLNCRWEII